MSALGMVQREMAADSVAEAVDGAGGDQIQDALTSIVTYIPTEIVTFYTAVIAWRGEALGEGKPMEWGYFIAFWIASPLLVLFMWKFIAGRNRPALPFPGWAVAASIISFPFWAATLKPSPFTAWPDYNATLAGLLLVGASLAIGLGARAWGPQP